MWHLKKTSKPGSDKSESVLDKYVLLLKGGIKNRIEKHRYNVNESRWCDYLLPHLADGTHDEGIIDDILTAEPKRLFKINTYHLNGLLNVCQSDLTKHKYRHKYSERQLRHYIKAKSKRKRTGRQTSLVNRYERLFNFLLEIFDYDLVRGEIAYEIAKMKEVNTCTYCNRLYTFTIGKEYKKGKCTSMVKPQFDHWFAHSQYPLLSLSFYNLIPCCSVCNSSVKGSAHFSLKTHIHPYLAECEPKFEFKPDLISDSSTGTYKWSVLMEREPNGKEDHTIKDLSLDIIYKRHGELEVKDIMDFEIKNNSTYLKSMFENVCKDFQGKYTREHIYRMMFGVEADVSKTLDRPLSKLKRDILRGEGIIV